MRFLRRILEELRPHILWDVLKEAFKLLFAASAGAILGRTQKLPFILPLAVVLFALVVVWLFKRYRHASPVPVQVCARESRLSAARECTVTMLDGHDTVILKVQNTDSGSEAICHDVRACLTYVHEKGDCVQVAQGALLTLHGDVRAEAAFSDCIQSSGFRFLALAMRHQGCAYAVSGWPFEPQLRLHPGTWIVEVRFTSQSPYDLDSIAFIVSITPDGNWYWVRQPEAVPRPNRHLVA
jgi:hypothetical protein